MKRGRKTPHSQRWWLADVVDAAKHLNRNIMTNVEAGKA